MKRILAACICLLLCSLGPGIACAQDSPSSKKDVEEGVMRGLLEWEDYCRTRQQQLEEEKRKQEGILQRARAGQSASDHTVRQENQKAESVVQSAIAITEEAIRSLKAALHRITTIRTTYLRKVAPAKSAAIAKVKGHVTIQSGDRPVRVADFLDVLHPGDVLTTDSDGSVELVTVNGRILQLGSNSSMILVVPEQTTLGVKPPPPPPQRVEVEEPVWKVLKGTLHYYQLKLGEYLRESISGRGVLSPYVAVAVRGTEFDLKVNASGLTQVIPYDGTIELAADSRSIDQSTIDRWWEQAKQAQQSAAAELISGKELQGDNLLRVLSAQGDVTIKRDAEAKSMAASPGDLLKGKDTLATGNSGAARVQLHAGITGVVGANATLQAAVGRDSSEPLYGLWKGTFHLVSHRDSTSSKERGTFVTPSSLMNTQGAEFDVSVNESGMTTITPYSGKITITAQMKESDRMKLARWWDDMYK